MNHTTIGTMLTALRTKKNYTRKQLCRGLCTIQMLEKIERDMCDTDKFLLDMLLQRLGKSPDKLELILSEGEYRRIRMRDLIEELIWKQKKEKAQYLLEKYEEQYAKNNRVQKMYVLRTRAYISHRLDQDAQAAETCLTRAVELTMPGIRSDNMMQYLIAGEEMENLLALGQCRMEQGVVQEAEAMFAACQRYLDTYVTDREDYVKLYSKCAWLLSRIYIQREEYVRAYGICEAAIEDLRKYGILYFMVPLLEQLICCSKALHIEDGKNKWKIYHEILSELYQKYAPEWFCQDSLFHNCRQTTWHLDWEFIRQERLSQNLTQEQLIEGVYESPETLSRIENGKTTPGKKRLEGLLEKLGAERGKYCGTAVVEDFETLELKLKVEKSIGRGDYEQARMELEELQKKLDPRWKANAMVLGNYRDIIESRTNQTDARRLLEREKELLQLSYRMGKDGYVRVPLRNELMILNQICLQLKKLGRSSEAEDICRNILKTLQKSRMKEKYRYEILCLPLSNLATTVEEEKICKAGIAYELLCGKGTLLTTYVILLSHFEEYVNPQKEKKYIRQGYYLAELFYREEQKKVTRAYYENTYNEKLV